MGQTAPAQMPMTVAEFLAAYECVDERYELVDGVPMAMGRASLRHNRIMVNLLSRIADRLRGSPYEVFAAEMGLWVSDYNYRLPDLAIYCDPRDLKPLDDDPSTLAHPKVVFEILSRSTERIDHVNKLDGYQAIESVDTIVFVHRERNAFTTFERVAANEWRAIVHLPGQPLVLRDPALTISAEDVFAGV